MTFEAGSKLGHYQIQSRIGAGGMGEVYSARDSRLNRTVAVKVLPPHIADKPEARQRFEREAQAIAALNHPHICVIHDVGQHEGTSFMVMEYIEGETLADRLAKGAVPFDQLLTYAIQIADALDKAHRRGVVHRDLKPGNIMLTRTGVKLLDFGLAKLQTPLPAPSHSAETMAALTKPLTVDGTILGTLQYMSPEQLEGKEADARADIFAFGAVLYEMATGRRAFEGKSQVSVMAAILEHDPPPISELQPLAPALFDDVIRIALSKNPDDRWQSAADLLHELKLLVRYGTLPTSAAPRTSRKREAVAWVAAAVLLVSLVSTALFLLLRSRPAGERISFQVQTPTSSAGFDTMMLALSRDGSHLAYLAPAKNDRMMWVRAMDQVNSVALAGTENPLFPFWSPDGLSIGFFADTQLKRIDIAGGPPLALAPAANGRGGTWNRDGVILFAPTATGPLFRVQASAGGMPVQVTELNASRHETAHKHPWFLPDGDHFLYLVLSQDAANSGIYVGSLNAKDTERILPGVTNARFASPDRLLFMRGNTLMAQRFNTRTLKLEGEPIRVAEGVGTVEGTGNVSGFAVSEDGKLAYRPGGSSATARSLGWIDAKGNVFQTIGKPAIWENPRLSPDGKRVAVFKREGAGGDIWIIDLERGGDPSRFTFDPGEDNYPLWSSDGKRIIFASNREDGVFNLYEKSSAGTGEETLLLKSTYNKTPTDLSTDGLSLLYDEEDPKNLADIWILNLTGEHKASRFVGTPFVESRATFSPDTRWITYSSNEAGNTFQVYGRDYPASGGKWQVSLNGGNRPRWRPDGKELFFSGLGGQLFGVDLTGTTPGGSLKWGEPQLIFSGLFGGPTSRNSFDVSKDSTRILVLSSSSQPEGGSTPALIVVLNWASGLLP